MAKFMAGRRRTPAWRMSGAAAILLLSGCGDGGGVNSTPTPTPAPVPAPTPGPTPTPTPAPAPTPTPSSSYDTAEYRATAGAVSLNALAAYQQAATGAGITVGIVDSGIDTSSAEFGSRVLGASANVAGGTGIADEGGHGTAVAFTLAGRRNGTGTQGVAFDASLLIARTDTPGSCATKGADGKDKCSFADSAIGRGIDLAANGGARVINLSLGGSPAGMPVIDAINRATSAGVIVIIAAGNDGTANPDPFAEVANAAEAHGLVIIAGSVGINNARTPGADTLSDFSDKAGDGAAHFLAAVGEEVHAPDNHGVPYIWSGTSFAAPQIAGAVALLAQAFPRLTGAQIVSILYTSARDAGAAGVDPVYGQGVLDLTRAFAPLGATSVAGTAAPASLATNASLSAPMGDAQQGPLGAIILDGYRRAYAIDLARTIGRPGPSRGFAGALTSRTQASSVTVAGTTVSFTVAPVAVGPAAVDPTRLSEGQAGQARATAGSVVRRLGDHDAIAIGFAEGETSLAARLAGRVDPAFLVAGDPAVAQGFDVVTTGASAVRHDFGALALTGALEAGDVVTRRADAITGARDSSARSGYGRASIALDRQFGALDSGVTATRLGEARTLLGARFGDALGATRATSWFVDGRLRWTLAGGWGIGGSLRRGWTIADVGGGLAGSGRLRTEAFAADLGKDGVFAPGDSAGLRIAEPLRVASGGVDLRLPTGYDDATGRVDGWTAQRLNLAPTGREIDIEAVYATPLLGGALQTNMFWRRDPGNFASLAPDLGAALRWSTGF